MQSIKKKIIKRITGLCLTVSVAVAAVYFGGTKVIENALFTSVVKQQYEPPVIVLDAGHGGMDGGCSSVNGTPEKGINLNIMLHLRRMLQICGYTVEVTRETDCSIHDEGIEGIANQKSSDMDNRLELFNKYDNAVCLSIHQNQFTDSSYSGAQMFYSNQVKGSAAMAQNIQDSFVEFLQPENKREIKLCGKELFLCYFCKNPTVMVECGFLSNPEEASLLETEEYQQKVAFTVFSGLEKYFSSVV
ncbi:MAG: N-acetylmuramoyl-L-alanine amidase [Oscillospiraceae bacterium]|nr:N-acetylmuramoyl-L-alanine amidase [Oscillospiraceae bacterium]